MTSDFYDRVHEKERVEFMIMANEEILNNLISIQSNKEQRHRLKEFFQHHKIIILTVMNDVRKSKDDEWLDKVQRTLWALKHPKKGEKVDELKKRVLTIIDDDVTFKKYWEWRENNIREDVKKKYLQTLDEIDKLIHSWQSVGLNEGFLDAYKKLKLHFLKRSFKEDKEGFKPKDNDFPLKYENHVVWLENEMSEIKNPYPEDIFKEPTKKQWFLIQKLFTENGLVLDAFSASIGRFVFKNTISDVLELIRRKRNEFESEYLKIKDNATPSQRQQLADFIQLCLMLEEELK